MLVSKKVSYDRRLVALLPFRTDPDYLLNTGVIPIPEYATKTLVVNLTFTFSPASLADGRQKPVCMSGSGERRNLDPVQTKMVVVRG